MPHFACRLIAPRPSFMLDMTPDEGALMQTHAGYWRTLLDRGTALLFGPVADPAGGWGLAVIEVANQDEAAALTARDPVIEAGAGFRYEILPMPTVVLGRASA